MKRGKKLVALALTLVFSLSLLSACGGNSEELVTLTVYSQLANYNGEITGWGAQLMREKFNVRIVIIDDQDGVYETRMESGNLGDIVVWGGNGDQYINAIKQGMLWDWDDEDLLVNYGQTILQNMPMALENNRDLTEREVGTRELYGFGHNVAPNADSMGEFFYTWDFRWDIYRDIGHPEMKNLDDFVDVLEQMRDHVQVDDIGNPVYAVSLWPDWDGDMVMYVKSMATAYYGYEGDQGLGHYNSETGDFYPALDPNSPYLNMLAFFNELYRRGLLDPDSMTHTAMTSGAKVQNGGTLFSIFNYAGSANFNTPEHIANDQIMLPYAPEDARPINEGLNPYGGSRIWSIGSKTQHPELCMEIIDWFCTPEGFLTLQYGPRGTIWDYNEEGKAYFTEFGAIADADQNTEMIAPYSGKFGDGNLQINNTTWNLMTTNPDTGEPYSKLFWESYQKEPQNAAEADWREKTGATSVHEYMVSRPGGYVVIPGSQYSGTPMSRELRSTWEQVTKSIVTDSWRAIYANSIEEYQEIVEQMVESATAYGYETCIEWSFAEAALRYEKEQEALGNR